MSRFSPAAASRRITLSWLLALFLALASGPLAGHAEEMRFALVIGNDEYKSAKLTTPVNDAGLVANALTAAGFTVTGARNLDQATLRESFREFVGQVAAAGPDAIAVVYLAGYGVQFAGENYYVSVDADIARDADVPLQALRVSDFAQPLAALPGRVKIVIVDAARENSLAAAGEPLASGLALVDPPPGVAIAFNAAPGTVGPDEPGPYGAYATALTEMLAAGGLSLDDLFARVRLRVSEITSGGEVPWYASQIDGPFVFTERAADAPPAADVVSVADLRAKPMRSYSSVEDAYAAALALDTIEGYEQFLELYPSTRFSRRVAAMLAVRREQIIWRHCVFNNTPPAYWSYLRRYPDGPHAWDARRRLAMLHAAYDAPQDLVVFDFGVPPPPREELVFVDRPVVAFWGRNYEPPPPPPPLFLQPRPREFVALPPPPPPRERFFLPAPQAAVVPAFVKPPHTVVVQPRGTAPTSAPVVLPTALQQGSPGTRPGTGSAVPSHHPVGGQPASAPPPATAAVKPAPPPPPPTASAPATVNPASPPPHPATAPAMVKPTTPPPAASPSEAAVKPASPQPHPATAPAMVKPATPPPAAPPGEVAVKPASPPPHPATAPAMVKPATPPPAAPPGEVAVKPASPPPHPAIAPAAVRPASPPSPPSAPAPAAIKPAPPPPPPPPHTLAPAVVKPAAPPPPPAAPAATAKPAAPSPTAATKPSCPPGKTLAEANGHPTCK